MWLAISSIVLAAAIGFNVLALWLTDWFKRNQPEILSVESRGGISPPRAPRHVREPLDSYGSRCSAVAMT